MIGPAKAGFDPLSPGSVGGRLTARPSRREGTADVTKPVIYHGCGFCCTDAST